MSSVEKASSMHEPVSFAASFLELFAWFFLVFDAELFQESAQGLTKGLVAGLC